MSTATIPERPRLAVFLDRDGVLIEEVGLLTQPEEVRLEPDVPAALGRLHGAGLALVVVTNQPVIARGTATIEDVNATHRRVAELVRDAGGPEIDGWYVCPHHPHADLARYRVRCDCRKPRPGMLLQAADDLDLDLPRSFMVGDRPTDVAAGRTAGCRTLQLRRGAHREPPIVTADPLPPGEPDHECDTLIEAADWILARLG